MPTAERRRAATHWALLLAVIAGILGMHILTSGNGAGAGHGAMSMPAASAHEMSAPEPTTQTATTATAPDAGPSAWRTATAGALPPMSGHGEMTACVLFLAVGGALLMLSALARHAGPAGAGPGGSGGRLLGALRRRGPPIAPTHLSLQVIRV